MEITKLFCTAASVCKDANLIAEKRMKNKKPMNVFRVSNCKPLSLKLHEKNFSLIIPHIVLLIYIRNIGATQGN